MKAPIIVITLLCVSQCIGMDLRRRTVVAAAPQQRSMPGSIAENFSQSNERYISDCGSLCARGLIATTALAAQVEGVEASTQVARDFFKGFGYGAAFAGAGVLSVFAAAVGIVTCCYTKKPTQPTERTYLLRRTITQDVELGPVDEDES